MSAAPGLVVIVADDTPAQPGATAAVHTRAAGLARGSAWRVRISRADIDRDGPFSAYPGVERWFAVLPATGRAALHDRRTGLVHTR
jgi:environmental stress-induced protein Ves